MEIDFAQGWVYIFCHWVLLIGAGAFIGTVAGNYVFFRWMRRH